MNELEKYDWMVLVRCNTYNHAPYIVEAMNGFTMQETHFPFVCVIVDDASTDGEQSVIDNYLNEHFDIEDKSNVQHEETDDYILTFARHKTNLNCYFVGIYLKYNHYSLKKPKVPYFARWRDKAKYIAICEGDDYWIDSLKLQKQVHFLENNPGFVECSHNFYIKDERKVEVQTLVEYPGYKQLEFAKHNGVLGFVFDSENYWDNWYTQPLSVVLRNYRSFHDIPHEKYKYYRDVIQHYYYLKKGKGMLLMDIMGVYRKTNGGVYAGKKIIDNERITNNNLRTIYLVERDERVLPVLNKNVISLWREAFSHFKIKESFTLIKDHYRLIPKDEVLPFTKMLVVEPFMIIKRKLTGIKKKR